jgi:hypothetical protein
VMESAKDVIDEMTKWYFEKDLDRKVGAVWHYLMIILYFILKVLYFYRQSVLNMSFYHDYSCQSVTRGQNIKPFLQKFHGYIH